MKVKKAQVGVKKKPAVKMVESEMHPGKMIPETAIRRGAYITIDSKKKPAKPAPKKNMKSGGKSFPDLNKDGKITKADILKGRGVIAKSGAALKKQAAKAVAMKKAGKAPKKAMGGKCKYGC